MSEFKREHRYVVLKVKYLKHLSPEGQQALSAVCDEVAQIMEQHGKPPFDCVVVEESWPEYETVWAMIKARMTGENEPVDSDVATRFRGICSMLGIGTPESNESLMLCQFSLLGMIRHKISQLYSAEGRPCPSPN